MSIRDSQIIINDLAIYINYILIKPSNFDINLALIKDHLY